MLYKRGNPAVMLQHKPSAGSRQSRSRGPATATHPLQRSHVHQGSNCLRWHCQPLAAWALGTPASAPSPFKSSGLSQTPQGPVITVQTLIPAGSTISVRWVLISSQSGASRPYCIKQISFLLTHILRYYLLLNLLKSHYSSCIWLEQVQLIGL